MNPDASVPFPGRFFTLNEDADWVLSLQEPHAEALVHGS